MAIARSFYLATSIKNIMPRVEIKEEELTKLESLNKEAIEDKDL